MIGRYQQPTKAAIRKELEKLSLSSAAAVYINESSRRSEIAWDLA